MEGHNNINQIYLNASSKLKTLKLSEHFDIHHSPVIFRIFHWIYELKLYHAEAQVYSIYI